MVDASDSTINLNTGGSSTDIQLDSVADKDPLSDPQTQPRVLARQVPSSTARGQMQLGAPNIFTDSGNRRIMVQDDSQVNVAELGNIGVDSSGVQLWGFKVAQPGVDVTTATDSQLIFNSQQDVFKIVKSGQIPITVSYTFDVNRPDLAFNYGTVQHNLGFAPLVLASFAASTAGGGPFPGLPLPFVNWGGLSFLKPDGVGGTTTQTLSVPNYEASVNQVTSTSVTFEVGVAQSLTIWNNQIVTIQYWLLQESATTTGNDTGNVL